MTVKFSVEKLKNQTTDIYIFVSILSVRFVNDNYKNKFNPPTYSAKAVIKICSCICVLYLIQEIEIHSLVRNCERTLYVQPFLFLQLETSLSYQNNKMGSLTSVEGSTSKSTNFYSWVLRVENHLQIVLLANEWTIKKSTYLISLIKHTKSIF